MHDQQVIAPAVIAAILEWERENAGYAPFSRQATIQVKADTVR